MGVTCTAPSVLVAGGPRDAARRAWRCWRGLGHHDDGLRGGKQRIEGKLEEDLVGAAAHHLVPRLVGERQQLFVDNGPEVVGELQRRSICAR
ncbi:Protein of unknown function, partial [Gryllus bimaculatus]